MITPMIERVIKMNDIYLSSVSFRNRLTTSYFFNADARTLIGLWLEILILIIFLPERSDKMFDRKKNVFAAFRGA